MAMDNPAWSLVSAAPSTISTAVAVKISGETGEVLELLEDKEGKTMKYVSEAYERDDGKLWFGSVYWPAVWVLDRK